MSAHISLLCAQNINDTDPPDQEESAYFVGFDAGMHLFQCQSRDYDFIRKEAGYYDDYASDEYSMKATEYSFAFKAEYRTSNDKWWIASGLRYASVHAGIGDFGLLFNSGSDYFYVMLNHKMKPIFIG